MIKQYHADFCLQNTPVQFRELCEAHLLLTPALLDIPIMSFQRWEPFFLVVTAAARNDVYMQGEELSPQWTIWLGKGNTTLEVGE